MKNTDIGAAYIKDAGIILEESEESYNKGHYHRTIRKCQESIERKWGLDIGQFCLMTRADPNILLNFRSQKYGGVAFPKRLRDKGQEFFGVVSVDRSGLVARNIPDLQPVVLNLPGDQIECIQRR